MPFIGIAAHRVILVVIANGIAEVDGIGGIRHERILQFNHNLLSCSLDIGHFHLSRRYYNLVSCIGKLYVLVEEYGYLLGVDIGGLVVWSATYYLWRVVVVPSAIGLSHTGATNHS